MVIQLFKKVLHCIILVNILVMANTSAAQVNWQLQLGGMMTKEYGGNEDLNYAYGELQSDYQAEWKAGVLIQIPVSESHPIFIETGLSFRSKNVISQRKDYKFIPSDFSPEDLNKVMSYRGYSLELPIKAGWKLRFNDKNAIDFGVGPYGSFITERGEGNPFSLGLNVSASFRHRCMSFGVEWQNPIFINGPRNYYCNSFLVTVGINFKGKKINLDKLANSFEIASGVLSTANQYFNNGNQQSEQNAYYNENTGNYTSTNSNSVENASHKKVDKSTNEKEFSIAEQNAYNADKRTYSNWETYLIKGTSDGSLSTKDINHAQSEMKKIRTKWEKRGRSWTKSKWEGKY